MTITHKKANMKDPTAPLYGLILSGGKSSRMGTDKALLEYHGLPQRDLLYQMVAQVCEHTFLSMREEQLVDLKQPFPYILDKNEYKGPFNGLLSAHATYPTVAWLVFACDLPLLDQEAIAQLVRERDPHKDATSFATRQTGLPEPLAAIWEPRGLKKAIDYLYGAQSSCPRKFLINADTKIIFPENDRVLMNANSMEDFKRIQEILQSP
jgi:molybdopterin-guanine dinucleotide biosynthesis protein A